MGGKNIHTVRAQDVSALDWVRANMLCPTSAGRSAAAEHAAQAVNGYLDWLSESKGLAPSSVYNYASVLVRFLDQCVGDAGLEHVTPQDVQAWLMQPRTGTRSRGKVAGPATRARNISIIRGFYKYLNARGVVSSDLGALLVQPKVPDRHPRPLDDDTWLAAWNGASPDDPQWFLTLALGGLCGLRRAELASLEPHHVGLGGERLLYFVRKGGGDDVVDIADLMEIWASLMPHVLGRHTGTSIMQALDNAAREPGCVRVLGFTSPDAVNKAFKRHGAPFVPHQLRHTFVTNLRRAGVPLDLVSELANHSDISVTMGYNKTSGGRVSEFLRERSTTVPLARYRNG